MKLFYTKTIIDLLKNVKFKLQTLQNVALKGLNKRYCLL